jgi:proteasome-associated ATPase
MTEPKITLGGVPLSGFERVSFSFERPKPPPEGSRERLEYDLRLAARERDEIRQLAENYEKAFSRLKEASCGVGIVCSVGNSRVSVRVGPISFECAAPHNMTLAVGDYVRLAPQTNQIAEVVDVPKVGMAAKVENVSGSFCDVTIMNTRRRIVIGAACGELKTGDTVIVDEQCLVAIDKAADAAASQVFEAETHVSWNDIGGLTAAKEALREAIEYPIKFAKLYQGYGKKPSKGVLLYGPPGNGKTMLGKAVATALRDVHQSKARGGFIYVKGPELLNKWVGSTEEAIRGLFDRARRYRAEHGHPAVLFIDEADALLTKRGGVRAFAGMELTIVPMFLAEMDGLEETGAFVMLSTNLANQLDPAVVRDGRIDRKIKIGRPDRETAKAVLELHTQSLPFAEPAEEVREAALDAMFHDGQVVRTLDIPGHRVRLLLRDVISGAVVAGVVNRATDAALERDRTSSAKKPSGVTARDMTAAAAAAARELADTDLTRDIRELVEREHGQQGIRALGQDAP